MAGDCQAAEPPGHDVLLCAPTGSGKTLAAFLWTINRLVIGSAGGVTQRRGFGSLRIAAEGASQRYPAQSGGATGGCA